LEVDVMFRFRLRTTSLFFSFASTTLRGAILTLAIVARPALGGDEPANGGKTSVELLDYEIKVDTVLQHDDGTWIWFHPRVAAIPGAGRNGGAAVLMTLQKHLFVSDYYSGLSVMRTDDLGGTWSEPDPRPELSWREEGDGVTVAVCDVTPGWHPATGKAIAIGAKVRYDKEGQQLYDTPDSREAAYAVHDPMTGEWSKWQILEMPDTEGKFYQVTPGCTQWIVERDGNLLVPIYFSGPSGPASVTVLRCSFDGRTMKYLEHGDELELKVVRGLCEPSIALSGDRYFLTIRNDEKGYVTSGEDGLHYQPISPWTFDDGAELGSYNTQQHWLTHSEGIFLTYTRRGADNDHIFRHRAPLFIAQVDPDGLCVIRESEQILIPERGAQLGNFGASAINENESWVTVGEGLFGEARERGAEGCVFSARVLWSKPNALAPRLGALEP
jgi:hypothetical protein